MLDNDLAELYGVETKYLNKAVNRNKIRFPDDFMYELTSEEFSVLKKQLGHEGKYGGTRKLPRVFTENGVAMLSGVLNSERAILVNISIMRIFTKLKSFIFMEEELGRKINNLKDNTDKLFRIVFERLDTIEQTVPCHDPKRKRIGLRDNESE